MTDEKFEKTIDAIAHLLRVGHIIETGLGGKVDEDKLVGIVSGVHVDHEGAKARAASAEADVERLTRENDALRRELDERSERIEDLADSLDKARAEARDATRRLDAVTQALRIAPADDGDAAPVPYVTKDMAVDMADSLDEDADAAPDAVDEDMTASDAMPVPEGAVWLEGDAYLPALDNSAVPRRPGVPRPVLVDGVAYRSLNDAVRQLMPEGASLKSAATKAMTRVRRNEPWEGHDVRYLLTLDEAAALPGEG